MTAEKPDREPRTGGCFSHNPDSPASALALAVVVAEATAGGIPDAPVELTTETWESFWQKSVSDKAHELNPPPPRSWQTLLQELERKEGTVTLDRSGPPGNEDKHEVMVELVGHDVVRVSFRTPPVT